MRCLFSTGGGTVVAMLNHLPGFVGLGSGHADAARRRGLLGRAACPLACWVAWDRMNVGIPWGRYKAHMERCWKSCDDYVQATVLAAEAPLCAVRIDQYRSTFPESVFVGVCMSPFVAVARWRGGAGQVSVQSAAREWLSQARVLVERRSEPDFHLHRAEDWWEAPGRAAGGLAELLPEVPELVEMTHEVQSQAAAEAQRAMREYRQAKVALSAQDRRRVADVLGFHEDVVRELGYIL